MAERVKLGRIRYGYPSECRVCHSRDMEPKLRVSADTYTVSIHASCDIVICQECIRRNLPEIKSARSE